MTGWQAVQRETLPSGVVVACREMAPSTSPRAVVHVLHGAAEHGGRYEEMATRFAAQGYHVFAHDHRGHGQTTVPGAPSHTFGEGGWDGLVGDAAAIIDRYKDRSPDAPRVVLGHSMGSLAAFDLALRHPTLLDALVLMGPIVLRDPLLPVFRPLLSLEGMLASPQANSWLFDRLAWKKMSASVKPQRTPVDWLSTDHAAVDAYIADPDAGWPLTVNVAAEMARGLAAALDDKRLAALPEALPILIMSGTDDPSSGFGKAVHQLRDRLAAAQRGVVQTHLFDGMRHELHNEADRHAVYDVLLSWCDQAVERAQTPG